MVFVNSLLFWGLAISLAGALWVDTDNQTVMDSHRETYKVPTMGLLTAVLYLMFEAKRSSVCTQCNACNENLWYTLLKTIDMNAQPKSA